MATPTPWSNTFLVNTTRQYSQSGIKTAAFADGSFIAVWGDAGWAVKAQFFNADGSKKGAEFLVNTTDTNAHYRADIEVLSDGRFVVVWDERYDSGSSNVRGRIFNADGSAFDRAGDGTGTGDFIINENYIGFVAPSVAALSNGGFIVSSVAREDGIQLVQTQAYDSRGIASGSENTIVSDAGPNTTVLNLGDRYAVLTNETGEDGMPLGITGRIYQLGEDLSLRQFMVPRTEGGSTLTGGAVLADGRMVVTWTSYNPADGQYRSKAQIFGQDGTRIGSEITLGKSTSKIELNSGVTATKDGGFAVALMTTNGKLDTVSQYETRIVVVDAHGAMTGNDLLIEDSFQPTMPQISSLADGRLVVTWTSFSGNGVTRNDVYGKIIDARGAAVSLAGTAKADEYYGTAFNDTLGGAGGSDKLNGGAGDDIINGGAGADVMSGGAGNDTYFVDNENDVINDTSGTHTIIATTGYILNGVRVSAPTKAEPPKTETGKVEEKPADVVVTATSKGTKFVGNDMDNKLYGSVKNDSLTGGAGQDTFVFNTKPGKSNKDNVTDFDVQQDAIWLDNAIFTKLGKKGSEDAPAALNKKYFVKGTKAKDKNDYVIYDKKKGILYYDADGSGSKSKPVEIVKLAKNLNLSAADLFVV